MWSGWRRICTDREQALEMARNIMSGDYLDERIANCILEARARECERVPRPSSILRAAELRAQITHEEAV